MNKILMSLVVMTSCVVFTGCVSQSQILTNAEGKRYQCSSNGFGIIGTPVAMHNFESCVKAANEKGYR